MEILIVSNDHKILDDLKKYLIWLKYSYQIANNSKTAIEILKKSHINIVISDVDMPELNGIELNKYISENHPDIYVILIAEFQEIEAAASALRYGVYDFIRKPFELVEIKKRIENIFTRKL